MYASACATPKKASAQHKAETYRLLENLNATVFKRRDTFLALNSPKLLLNPICLVVLPYSVLELNPISQKVFTGMIGVLNIPSASMCTVWPSQANLPAFISGIRELAAHSILLLGEIFNTNDMVSLNHAIDHMGCHRVNSFDPNTLVENTELKARAYQDLLALKKFLWGQL